EGLEFRYLLSNFQRASLGQDFEVNEAEVFLTVMVDNDSYGGEAYFMTFDDNATYGDDYWIESIQGSLLEERGGSDNYHLYMNAYETVTITIGINPDFEIEDDEIFAI